jgi:hypothetical protein
MGLHKARSSGFSCSRSCQTKGEMFRKGSLATAARSAQQQKLVITHIAEGRGDRPQSLNDIDVHPSFSDGDSATFIVIFVGLKGGLLSALPVSISEEGLHHFTIPERCRCVPHELTHPVSKRVAIIAS